MSNLILGVDPGCYRTGLSIVEGGQVFWHKTVPGAVSIAQVIAIHSVYKFKRAAVEMPKQGVLYQRYMQTIKAHKPDALKFKICMDIGKNIGLTEQIVHTLQSRGVRVRTVNPVANATKWELGYWCRIFKWQEKRHPSEHARDAAVLAFLNENWPGWRLPEENPMKKGRKAR